MSNAKTASKLIDRAKAHFNARRSMDIPEWPDETGAPARIFWSPVSVQKQQALKAAVDAKDGDQTDYAVRLIVDRAEDESGAKLFTIEDLPALRSSVDSFVLTRIVQAMSAPASVKDAEKN